MFQVYTMAVRLSALAEQNMKRILNTFHNLNKKGKYCTLILDINKYTFSNKDEKVSLLRKCCRP